MRQAQQQKPAGTPQTRASARATDHRRTDTGHNVARPDVCDWIVQIGLIPLAMIFLTIVLASCTGATIKHGHHFRASDLNQVQTGMSKTQVTQVLGTPDTTSPVGGGTGYYYISSVEKQTAFFKPDEVERKVVAVYFNELESVDKVAHYGLKDGKVFNFIDRETGTHARDESILKSLFRNLGKQQGLF